MLSERNLGLRQVIESHSRPWVLHVFGLRLLLLLLLVLLVALTCPLATGAVVAVHARNTVTPMHVAHNSGEASVSCLCRGPLAKTWGGGRKGPTGTKRVKGGVSGPAEDLHPVPEVEAGVNFRPAGRVRGQVAGQLLGRHPGTGTRRSREGAVTPSLHPEVPDTQIVTPGRGLGIRQSMGWTKVCETARSGIWVLKG